MADNIETYVARLDERLKALEKKTDDHHVAILTKMQELKDGLVDRVSKLELQVTRIEAGKLSSTDYVAFRNNEYVPMVKKVDDMNQVMETKYNTKDSFQTFYTEDYTPTKDNVAAIMRYRWYLMGSVTILAPMFWYLLNHFGDKVLK